MSVGQFAWHVHHDKLVEVLTESIEARQEYIQLTKPQDEIDTRLRLLKPVVGELPAAVVEAGRACLKTRQALDEETQFLNKAWRALDKAWEAFNEALRTHASELNTLHAQECPDCPWDGRSILGNTQ